MLRNRQNIISRKFLITLVAYTTRWRLTAETKKEELAVLDSSSDSPKSYAGPRKQQREKQKTKKGKLLVGSFATVHIHLIGCGDLVLYVLFASYCL